MRSPSLLDHITIVLVDTRNPSNIGAVARSMMNMGLGNLTLVDPPDDPNHDASKLAAGADEVLNAALTVTSLSEAVRDHNLVVGATRHTGKRRTGIRTPAALAGELMPLLPDNRIAIVFGNEINGLTVRDLALCHELVMIPSSPAFPSLNLSHAVMVVAYELYQAATLPSSDRIRTLATVQNLECYFDRLQSALLRTKFLDQVNADRVMVSIRRIYGRARLTERDLAILQGILTALDRRDE